MAAASKRTSAVGVPTSNAACPGSAKAVAAAPSKAGIGPDRIGRRAPPVPIAGARREGRAERGDRRAVAVGRGAPAFAREAFLQRVHDQRAHQAGIAEPHLGLGRMHIGVDLARIERHEQRHHRMAVARQIVGIGRAHRAENQLVAHRAAIDEQILPERVGPRQRRRGGKAFDHDAVALGAHLDGAERENPRPEYRRAASAGRRRRAMRRPR